MTASNTSPLKSLKTKSSLTSYSLTVHEFSTGTYIYSLIYLFIYLFILLAFIDLLTALA